MNYGDRRLVHRPESPLMNKTSEPPCAACGLLDSAENPHAAHGGSAVFSSNSYLRDFLDDVQARTLLRSVVVRHLYSFFKASNKTRASAIHWNLPTVFMKHAKNRHFAESPFPLTNGALFEYCIQKCGFNLREESPDFSASPG